MYQMFCYFFIYAFLGWCCEVAFAAMIDGKFVNRGFLNGPVCPIYGFGVIFVLYILNPVKNNFILLFIGSVILTSILEYFTGFILDKFFHKHWWDYSNERFNIKGYICLRFSILWGMACLIVVDIIQPIFQKAVTLLPQKLGIILLVVFTASIISDVLVTVIGINKTNKHLKLLYDTGQRLHRLSESLGSNISEGTINLVQKGDIAKEHFDEKRAKTKLEFENLQKRYEELRNNPPMTAKRIHLAFPDLDLIGKHKNFLNKIKEDKSND